jgi:FAD/FMN-containing dehydrogenase
MSLAQSIIRVIDAVYIYPLNRIFSRQFFGYGVCGATNMALMEGIKKVFDPNLILNPGKVCYKL